MRIVFVCLILGVLVCAAFAADVTGRWTAQVAGTTFDGSAITTEDTFVFKAAGVKLTGTASIPRLSGQEAGSYPIAEGKVDGNNISFIVPTHDGINVYFKGKVSGDTIEFSRSRDGEDYGTMPTVFTAKRVK
jgi:hypothetical protein